MRRPAREVARRLALEHLAEALAAARRMSRGEDTEALHDFRVGLRRLRSLERAYRPHLADSVKRKMRLRLKEAARETGGARDAEVQIAWLRRQSAHARGRAATGLKWILQRLEPRVADCGSRQAREWARSFRRLATTLQKRLSYYRVRVGKRSVELTRFKAAAAALLRERCVDLRNRLASLPTVDPESLHAARISAKRLRYLFEPLASLREGGERDLAGLRALQELLGSINDLHVLGPVLTAAHEAARIELPSAAAGVARILELASNEEAELQRQLSEQWLGGQAVALLASLESRARGLVRA